MRAARLTSLLLVAGFAVLAGFWWQTPTARVRRTVALVGLPADAVLVEDVTRPGDGCVLRPCPQILNVHTTALDASQACEFYEKNVVADWSETERLGLGPGAAVCGWVGVVDGVALGAVVEQVGSQVEIVLSGRLVA